MKNQLTKDVWVSGLSIILHSSTCLALYQYHTVLIILALYKLEVEKCKTCNFVVVFTIKYDVSSLGPLS